jgi:type VI secretion system secreted protein VgrG
MRQRPFLGSKAGESMRPAEVVVADHVEIQQYASFAVGSPEEPSYTATLEVVRCGEPGQVSFRPERLTPSPRVYGSQTAVVTAEPGQSHEINTGGEADLGCVRLRFAWDQDLGRHAEEPTSCWVRVSQMFAGGRGHGALLHPRVGDEVIVDFLEGDPDRPIITGRVYNGRNLAPDNATESPTTSYIKSMSTPYDGNYNMIAFDDQQGEEKFIVQAARDYLGTTKHDHGERVGRDATTTVGRNRAVQVDGDDHTQIEGSENAVVRGSSSRRVSSGASLSVGSVTMTSASTMKLHSRGNMSLTSDSDRTDKTAANHFVEAGSLYVRAKDVVQINAPHFHVFAGGDIRMVCGGSSIVLSPGGIKITSSGDVEVNGGLVKINC